MLKSTNTIRPPVKDPLVRQLSSLLLSIHLDQVPEVIGRGSVEMPEALAKRPQFRGFPIGYMFHVDLTGTPDFKALSPERMPRIATYKLCGLCGRVVSPERAVIVGGPITLLSGQSSDPPFHDTCARYACSICPFLLGRSDHAKSTKEMHEHQKLPGQVLLEQSPVIGIGRIRSWHVRKLQLPDGEGGIFCFDAPLSITWVTRTPEAHEAAQTGKRAFELLKGDYLHQLVEIAMKHGGRAHD